MDDVWRSALWRQFGAAIDTLDNAVAACPDSLWTERVWLSPPPPWFPPQFAEFWYVTFHTLVWLDLYLSGVPEEDFAPPAPFAQGELDSVEALPERPYAKEELRTYLAALRQKCHTTLIALTDEQACRPVEYPWTQGQPVSFLELLFYNMRHVQEHAAHLSLFLGQHAVPDADLDWVARVKSDIGPSSLSPHAV
jgi:DinB family protein